MDDNSVELHKAAKKFAVVEIFFTLQGEGFWTGTPAIFVRFSGCNLWTGRQATRAQDAARNDVRCPLWCDTDFAHPSLITDLDGLIDRIMATAHPLPRLCVLTGGEPLLQITPALVRELKDRFDTVAVETNGTIALDYDMRKHLWISVSPKTPRNRVMLHDADEVKVVFPEYDPLEYVDLASTGRRFVQPCAVTHAVGRSALSIDATNRTLEWLQRNPSWRLSLQTHKVLNLP